MKLLVKKINDLHRLINRSNENTWERCAILSDSINALIRSEYMFLHRDYICDFYSSKATINPDRFPEKVRINILPGEEYLYEKIFANSFGPFNPEEYFKIDRKYRIAWVLREPYIKSGSWYNGDRGGHNQAAEYRNWEDAKSIPTYRNLIEITKVILENLDLYYKGEKDEIMNKVMSHICILEANHFPGLAFPSTDSDPRYLRYWLQINKSLYNNLLNFYLPGIIITSWDILSYFVDNYDKDYEKTSPLDIINFMTSNNYKTTSSNGGYPSAIIFGERIKPYFNEHNISIDKNRNTKLGPLAIYDPSDLIWIGWYHTSSRNEMSIRNKKFIGNWIAEIIKKTN